MIRFVNWVVLVAAILIIGLVIGARAAFAQPVPEHACATVYQAAQAAYMASSRGDRPGPMIAAISDLIADQIGGDPNAHHELARAIVLHAFQWPKLSWGVTERWNIQIEQGAARYAADWETECLMAAPDK
jgi:hypothetical protein